MPLFAFGFAFTFVAYIHLNTPAFYITAKTLQFLKDSDNENFLKIDGFTAMQHIALSQTKNPGMGYGCRHLRTTQQKLPSTNDNKTD